MKEQEVIARIGSIYRVYCKKNQNSYIGQSIYPKDRIKMHLDGRGNILLAREIEKYGVESFKSEIIYNNIPEWMLSDLEIRTIKRLNTFEDDRHYNLSAGGERHRKRIDVWSDYKIIISRYLNNESRKRIGEDYDCSINIITSILKRYNIPIRKPNILTNLLEHEKSIEIQYQDGKSIFELAEEYKCEPQSIRYLLRSLGYKFKRKNIRSQKEFKEYFSKHAEEIKNQYELGRSIISLSKEHDCDVSIIRRLLKSLGCKIRRNKPCEKIKNPKYQKEIIERYKNGETLSDLEDDYECSRTVLSKFLRNSGYEIRLPTIPQIITNPEERKEVLERYKSGESISSIAKDYGCTRDPIKSLLKSFGYKIRSPKEQKDLDLRKRYPIWGNSIKIKNRYEQGESITSLARSYNCPSKVIRDLLESLSCKLRTKKEQASHSVKKRHPVWDHTDEVIRQYKNGETTRELSIAYNCCDELIKRILKPAGFNLRNSKRSPAWKLANEIREKYKKGYRLKELTKLYNCGQSTIERILKSEEK